MYVVWIAESEDSNHHHHHHHNFLLGKIVSQNMLTWKKIVQFFLTKIICFQIRKKIFWPKMFFGGFSGFVKVAKTEVKFAKNNIFLENFKEKKLYIFFSLWNLKELKVIRFIYLESLHKHKDPIFISHQLYWKRILLNREKFSISSYSLVWFQNNIILYGIHQSIG